MTDNSSSNSKEPVAGLSTASSCIRLSIQNENEDGSSPHAPTSFFRPVFTHQCFEKEFIPGYRPLVSAEDQSRHVYQSWKEDGDSRVLHTSYDHCQENDRIDVHVVLSPSCEICTLYIQTEKLSNEQKDTEDEEPTPKKQKKSVSFAVTKEDEDETTKQMSTSDIIEKISSATPPHLLKSITVRDKDNVLPLRANNYGHRYLTEPIGKVLHTYRRKIKGNEEEGKFIITLADGSDTIKTQQVSCISSSVADYHNKVQPLARWFIETADDVDLTDDTKGLWKVLYLFQDHNTSSDSSAHKLSLSGFITLLHVNSPFRKPKPGVIVRVCQALILPPYHRAGHGSTMLHCMHDYANATNGGSNPILEINVEDPAPGFVALRDTVDYQRYINLMPFPDCSIMDKYLITEKEYFLPANDVMLESFAEILKITKHQCQIVSEIEKLSEIENWKNKLADDYPNKDDTIKQVETYYRLFVKKSLKQQRIEELGACEGGKEEQKVLLGKWFDETLAHYQRVLKAQRYNS